MRIIKLNRSFPCDSSIKTICPISIAHLKPTISHKSMVFVFASLPAIILFSLLIESAQAANFYVRPNGGTYGNANGSNWDNAFNGFSGISWASVSCGDTVWVAGGTYTQSLSPRKKCSSGSRLYIKRARADATECTGAAGWNAGFNATVTQASSGIVFSDAENDYITISGRTTSSGGDYGWHIDFTGNTQGEGIYIDQSASYDYNTFEYIDIQGPGYVHYTGGGGKGIYINSYGASPEGTGNMFSHIKVHGWESGIYNTSIQATTYEYIEMYDIAEDCTNDCFHANGIYISGSNNSIVRYSRFHGNLGVGIFFSGMSPSYDGWKIYGNVFYDITESGDRGILVGNPIKNTLIYNNTFHNVSSPVDDSGPGYCSTGTQSKNNISYNSGTVTCGTSSNNLRQNTPNPFVNSATHDYHIVSTIGAGYPRNAGANLSSYFNKDMDEITFGGDGAWDIGAYEWSSGGGKTPAPPSDIQVR